MNIKDYETNVPEKIKIANKEKLDAYLLEKQQIEESLETMSKLI
jgi:hypothetical protein